MNKLYDPAGKPLAEIIADGSATQLRVFNAEGKVSTEATIFNSERASVSVYSYDEQDREMRRTDARVDGRKHDFAHVYSEKGVTVTKTTVDSAGYQDVTIPHNREPQRMRRPRTSGA